MSEFFVDLLPADASRLARQRTRFRTMLLTSALGGTVLFGLAMHSVVQARNAAAAHSVAADLSRSVKDLSDMIAPLSRERDHLQREMTAARTLATPVDSSAVLATLTHAMPAEIVLTELSLSLEPIANPAYEPARSASKKKSVPPADSVGPTIQLYKGTVHGIAPDDRTVREFARALGEATPFDEVNVEDTRTGGRGSREFTLSFTVCPWQLDATASRQLALAGRKGTP